MESRTRQFGNSAATTCQWWFSGEKQAWHLPISKHQIPVPQPMSNILFGFFGLSGAK
jgi:hypothetical protein